MKTIYFNGPILTMEQELYARAVLVEDGVIRKVGDAEEVLALRTPDTEFVDLRGRALLPAFIDPHSHITGLANTLSTVSLEGVKTFEEILERIEDYRREQNIPDGKWIIGFGYDHNLLQEKAHPDKTVLDRVCPGNPVVVSHASGHMGVMNSLGLQEMGINSDTPNPEGGVIGRGPDGKEPNGYLEETAFTGNAGKMPRPTLEDMCGLLEQAQNIYLSHGIATIQDGYTKDGEWQLLKKMADDGRLKADVVAYIDLKDCRGILQGHPEYQNSYRGHLRIGGYKIFLDGSPQGRTAWMTSPYLGEDKNYCGYPIYQNEQVNKFMCTALEDGQQILVHCNGDAAAQQMIDAYRSARHTVAGDIRPVMIHAQLVRPDQMPAMAELSIIASFFVAHTYYWGDTHIKNFGMARAEKISPVKSAAENGVVYTFHQDTPVIQPDMLMTIWCAVNRKTRDGVSLDGGEKVTPLEALRGVTINAAYQYFEEDRKGSIREGKSADFVILDRDPLQVPPDEIREISVLETIKDGVSVYRRETETARG